IRRRVDHDLLGHRRDGPRRLAVFARRWRRKVLVQLGNQQRRAADFLPETRQVHRLAPAYDFERGHPSGPTAYQKMAHSPGWQYKRSCTSSLRCSSPPQGKHTGTTASTCRATSTSTTPTTSTGR